MSRGAAVPTAALLLLLTLPAPAVPAQEALPGAFPLLAAVPALQAGTDSLRTIEPNKALLRSAFLPGWGQLYAGHPYKAVLIAVAEASFLRMTIRADRRVKDYAALRSSAGGGLTGAALDAEIERWRGERRRWLLWTFGAWVYAMVDAYVDAQLYDFDREEPDFRLMVVPGEGAGAPARIWLGLRIPLGGSGLR